MITSSVRTQHTIIVPTINCPSVGFFIAEDPFERLCVLLFDSMRLVRQRIDRLFQFRYRHDSPLFCVSFRACNRGTYPAALRMAHGGAGLLFQRSG